MIRPLIAAAAAVLALAGAPGGAVAGFEEGAAAYQAGDHVQAFAEWRPLAEAGDPAAQYNLGILYRQGEGVPADPERALDWFRRSAAQGNALAMFNLGLMLGSGDGVPADLPDARAWMALAERRADSEALRRDAAYLGGLLARQIGAEADAAALARAEALAGDAAREPAAAAGGAAPAAADRPAAVSGTTDADPPAATQTAETAAPIRPAPLNRPADVGAGSAGTTTAAAPAARPEPDPAMLALRPPARPADQPPSRSGIDRMREVPLAAADRRIARPSPAGAAAPPLPQSHGEPPLQALPAVPAAAPTSTPPAPAASQAPVRAAAPDAPADPPPGAQQEIAVLERVTPGGRGLTPPGAAVAGSGSSGGGFAVQIASLLSESDATAQWRRLRAAHPELLAELDPMVATGVVDGVTRYRLRLGPFDRSAAETFCRRLTDRGGDCYTVPY